MPASGCDSATHAPRWAMWCTSIWPSPSTATATSPACSSWCRPSTASERGGPRRGTLAAARSARLRRLCLAAVGRRRLAATVAGGRQLRRHGFHRQRKGALLGALQRTDADHLAGHFLAAIVADRDDDEILPGLLQRRVADDALHPQRGSSRHLALRSFLIEAQVVQAARTDAEAFEDRRLAVRAGARLARSHRARGDAHALP